MKVRGQSLFQSVSTTEFMADSLCTVRKARELEYEFASIYISKLMQMANSSLGIHKLICEKRRDSLY